MAAVKSVWAIDIGNNSLKALRLRQAGENIEVIGLDYIEYPKILSVESITDEERNQIIRNSLGTFAKRNDLSKDPIAISVPGQTSFARFIKLPPVELKRVPEIVKFEAVQQIPFDINEVEWDWQLMPKKDSPDIEVGIFAIKNEIVGKYLENFSAENIRISVVQMAPIAMYNYAAFDRKDLDDADKNAIVLLDMGADNTNLVVCTKTSVWQRCIPIGGNNFTKIIAEVFKLGFEKAEKLKRGAPVSKYARQIFQAMKPVLTDVGTEVQRSLGYYSSSHKNTAFSKILLFGGGLKLQGLNKYIQQTTQIPAVRPDAFEKLVPAQNISSAKLHENICDFAITYGLGLQALNTAKIQSNLLPAKIARNMMWSQKSKFFIVAALILLAASILALLRTNIDLKAYTSTDAENKRKDTANILQMAKDTTNSLNEQQTRAAEYQKIIEKYTDNFKYRDIIPLLNETIFKTMPNAKNNTAQAELYEAYAKGDFEKIKQIPRNQRKQVFITSMSIDYANSLAAAQFEIGRPQRFSRDRGAGIGRGESELSASPATTGAGSSEQQDSKGFIVIIEGYTPYEKIGELMDPAGAGDDKQKWGVITRMLNLNQLFDVNSPFELFQKNKIEHFKFETGLVDLQDQQMPQGIGVNQTKTRVTLDESAASDSRKSTRTYSTRGQDADLVASEVVLVDPLTKEEISRTFDLDEKGRKKYDTFGQPLYIERDRWFRIKAKFIWKDTRGQQGQAPTGM
ncbi:MAG: type IV pilus assembly protein PilM [Phycisphaerae bacterium]|nr:type IV pilus assembly protein PilM [Phycisphaerae bacterium]